jgi:hypothetical protein
MKYNFSLASAKKEKEILFNNPSIYCTDCLSFSVSIPGNLFPQRYHEETSSLINILLIKLSL